MIRFLQRDNRFTKAFFFVVIAAASVGMVVYLIPGLTGMGASTADTYAIIYPHWYSRYFFSGVTVSQQMVSQRVSRQMQSNPQYADNPMIVHYFEQQAGEQLVEQQVLLIEAEKLGIQANDADVENFLHQGQFGEYLFPGGQFIGTDRYTDFVARQFNMSVPAFEQEVKQEVVVRRIRALITASAKVSDAEVRADYLKKNVKIKFDYAVIASDALKDSIKPTDAELEAFFKKNAAHYAASVPEQRQVTYFAVGPSDLPGGLPQVSQQEVQQYFQQHQSEYTVPEQARSRHILIKVPHGADAKTDAAAKAKAEALLKQIKAGGNFADLAKANSDDPGSKDKGGELGFARRGMMVPPFENAIFTQKIGDTQIVKSDFGYHIVQAEERQEKHAMTLAEVAPTIQMTLIRKKAAAAEENFAQALTSEAIKNGLEKTATAHHLQFTTTPMVGERGVISAFADSSQVLSKAFAAKRGDPPQFASTGEGYAIFQTTGISPAHAPAFADWRVGGVKDYQNEQLPILLTQKTQELANKAKAEGDLAKAAKEVGATFKTSDLVTLSGQVPDLGAVGQVAPQLFDLKTGDLSGPINAGRTGVVAKLVDKQEPSADEVAKNFDHTRDGLLEQRQNEAFSLFMNSLMEDYRKHKRILIPKAKAEETPAS
ncbi:MAG: peptidylprolyl isomerase [Terracidiphilus sp.]